MGWGVHSWPFIVRRGVHCTGSVHLHTKKGEGAGRPLCREEGTFPYADGERQDGMEGNSFDILGRAREGRGRFILHISRNGYGRQVSLGDTRENASGMIGLHGLVCRGHSIPG